MAEDGATIAPEVSDEVWSRLLKAYRAVNFLNNVRSLGIRKGSTKLTSDELLIKGYTSLLTDIESGRDALQALSFPDSTAVIEGKEPVNSKLEKTP